MALLVDSRYKIPWIIWSRTYTATVSAGGSSEPTIAHGLPFIPLLVGQWSTSSSFLPSYDLTEISSTPPLATSSIYYNCEVSSDASRVYMSLYNSASASVTFYLRLCAFAPPDYTGDVTPVSYPNSNFAFNSQYRYQKIYMSGRTTGTSITHSLGYLPQARAWEIIDGRVHPSSERLTTTTLSSYGNPFYYHIYKDEF